MPEIGVKDLKREASHVLRKVREENASYDITYRGRVIARIVPVKTREERRKETAAIIRRMDEIAEEIGRYWPKGVSAAQAVSRDRR